jgi:hypothetical protein
MIPFQFSGSQASSLPNIRKRSLAFLLSFGITLTVAHRLQAAEPSNAPPQLTTLISQIDTTANQHNTELLKQFYSPNFTTSDGIDYTTFEAALQSLWKRYPDLRYSSQLKSWQKDGETLVAQTITTMEATSQWQGMPAKFRAVVEARQVFQGDKLLRQEILSEKTTLTSGTNPPQVDVHLPDRVKPNQEFDFDIILREPIGSSLLAGTAFTQDIDKQSYLNPVNLNLELLQSGGLFKRAKAPPKPEDRWLSALLVSSDGVTLVTQRLRVEK